jgi:hypothetical protein
MDPTALQEVGARTNRTYEHGWKMGHADRQTDRQTGTKTHSHLDSRTNVQKRDGHTARKGRPPDGRTDRGPAGGQPGRRTDRRTDLRGRRRAALALPRIQVLGSSLGGLAAAAPLLGGARSRIGGQAALLRSVARLSGLAARRRQRRLQLRSQLGSSLGRFSERLPRPTGHRFQRIAVQKTPLGGNSRSARRSQPTFCAQLRQPVWRALSKFPSPGGEGGPSPQSFWMIPSGFNFGQLARSCLVSIIILARSGVRKQC